ncbi:hypothetical protein E2C01_007969 [Portunus trituberculatus]|uniref:Uncharacterized protein n=1 Tax=Portunus trituberculatus TaxID=210409 RepID=A0A5B7D1J3_PORTR|nr:hypothetical protein [Portunus trituberculatus]
MSRLPVNHDGHRDSTSIQLILTAPSPHTDLVTVVCVFEGTSQVFSGVGGGRGQQHGIRDFCRTRSLLHISRSTLAATLKDSQHLSFLSGKCHEGGEAVDGSQVVKK